MPKKRRTIWMEGELSDGLDAICVRHGDITWHIENAVRQYLDGLKKPAKKKEVNTELQVLCREVWGSYSNAYFNRYGTEPVRNASVNSKVKQLAQRLGQDAVGVAQFYVSINDQWLIKNMHDIGNLLAKCESYTTQWRTGHSITTQQARDAERTNNNASAVQGALDMVRNR